ncbi:MAG: hypothetical protein J6S74_00440 [Alphaproteobacteria bacterium]|nr:hypothetical protein [Alphaproteobacteria bacterium]
MKTNDKDINLNKTPMLTLNTTDKLFFALARRDVDTLSYVYALVINNSNKNSGAAPSYPMNLETEISAFKTSERANVYYETAKLVMEHQKYGTLGQVYDMFNGLFKDDIEKFNKMATGFQTKTK